MKLDERSVFATFSPVLQRLSTVAWAGARAATTGARLQRDGAVGRVRVAGEQAVVATVFDGISQRVELTIARQELRAQCSCGEAPCAHAVAAALETARMARTAHAQVAQQDDVLAQLRNRLVRPAAQAESALQARRMLTDLARMPLDAAVDMVALAWRQAMRHTPQDVQDLLGLVDRIEADAREQREAMAELALRLLAALGATKVVFTGLPEATEPAIRTLARVALDRPLPEAAPAAVWSQLFDLADAGHPQVAVHVAHGLERAAMVSAPLATALAELLEGRVLAQRATWREVAAPTTRDVLADGLVGALLLHGQEALALGLARLWPPMRHGALALAETLARAGRHADVLALAEHYDPRGETWQSLLQAAGEAAVAEHPDTARVLAHAAWRRGPNPATFDQLARLYPGADWPAQRHALAASALADDDLAWLAERLAVEPDGAAALIDTALQWPLRERFQREALLHLEREAPEAAFRVRALRVHSLAVTNSAAKVLKDELLRLDACARTLGEPGLAAGLARLLAREVGEKAAWLPAVTAVFGKH